MMATVLIVGGLALWYGVVKWRAVLDRSDRQFRRKCYEMERSSRGWE